MAKRIMVVDDEPVTIKTCEFILEKNGYDVVPMASGQKCLDYLRNPDNPKVDLILLDIEMPVLNGYTTLSTIRQSESTKRVPVVFLTATATEKTVREAVRLGVNSYLKKPFLPQVLLDRVSEVLMKDAAENVPEATEAEPETAAETEIEADSEATEEAVSETDNNTTTEEK